MHHGHGYFIAHSMGFDMILGAFAAGMVTALFSKGEKGEVLLHKLDSLAIIKSDKLDKRFVERLKP